MKQRIVAIILAGILGMSLVACGNTTTDTSNEIPDTTPSKEEEPAGDDVVGDLTGASLEEILTAMYADYTTTIAKLNTELDKLIVAVGDTYEEYVQNQQLVTDWYTMAIAESEQLFERTLENSELYFKTISSSVESGDDDAIDDAMDNYYDVIYDDAMDEFYDNIYDDAMDTLYDQYYDGIVDEGYDLVPYKDWSNVSSDCYDAWSDANGDIYSAWSDASGDIYDMWSDVSGEFYDNNFALEGVFDDPIIKDTDGLQTTDTTDSDRDSTAEVCSVDIDPEFKATMDAYEEFFDEYVNFMKEYTAADADDTVDMLNDYTDMMQAYVDTMAELQALDASDMSTEEALYYAEVVNRINQKLLEVQ